MGIIDTDSFPEIRAALDVTLEEERLPDAVIAMGAYLGEAEREVQARVPDWATRTGVEAEALRVAVVLLTAAKIAPAMPVITREDRLAFSYTRQAVDWAAHAARLLQRADTALAPLEPSAASTGDVPLGVLFSLAHTRRGGF
jgi:hypothetical protein